MRFQIADATDAIPITPLTRDGLAAWLDGQPEPVRGWVRGTGFSAESGKTCPIPGGSGVGRVLLGVPAEPDLWTYGGLPGSLPDGTYRIDADLDQRAATQAALGWALGSYRFTRYKTDERKLPVLAWPERADRAAVERTAGAVQLVRDLVNTPAGDMGPSELAAAAEEMAREFGATFRCIVGDELLDRNYPAIHAVGRASDDPPRLIDIVWGEPDAPKVTLVGKGVCFDTGGLDIKPSGSMKLMKKDMGGGAHALGLARMIMAAGLPVRLRVLVPAVENAIAGNAFRPLDVLPTRKGLTVEIGNTDAEGRLVLCDALAEADAEQPQLLVDFATLTGAARVALGPDLPAMFTNDDALAGELAAFAESESDPMWRLPLWQPYRKHLTGKVADLNNIAEGGFAGAIYAALYLEAFVSATTPWVHFDVFAWNPSSRPGRPEGGEAMTLRAVYALIERRFAAPR